MTEPRKVYLTRAGQHGEDEEYALDHDLAIIGYQAVPSMEGAKTYEGFVELVKKYIPDAKKGAIGNFAGQLHAFAIAMTEGDLAVLPRKTTSQIALGRVTGPYKYRKIGGNYRHTRAVEWIRPDLPRTAFGQDLLYSFGAFLTVCRISRNDAELRIAAVLDGKPDPGTSEKPMKPGKKDPIDEIGLKVVEVDLLQQAHDQIVSHIQSRFHGHALARLVDAVLRADGWMTRVSPPGADGGVDILAGRGALGLDAPRLCVQVKSQNTAADVTVYRTLRGTMGAFKAEQGLLVCWGGFNKAVHREAREGHFAVRIWDSGDLVEAIYRNYEQLPAEIQAELPLKRVWMLVKEEAGQ
jgi:restriction system protein